MGTDERQLKALLLSNGHGEDVVGARIATELLELGAVSTVEAAPIVGEGEAYRSAGIEVRIQRRNLPAGGLTMHSLPLFLADMRAGFLSLTGSQLRYLAGRRADVLVTVGDFYAQLLANLVRAPERFVVQTLVSVRHAEGGALSSPNRWFMERITIPERLLMRHRSKLVFVRDEPTALTLHEFGIGNARFVGNPVADGLDEPVPAALRGLPGVIALLPGSRAYRNGSLRLMLGALQLLAADREVYGALAWTGAGDPAAEGWRFTPDDGGDGLMGRLEPQPGALAAGRLRVLVYRDRFAGVLQAAVAALGTSGTAHEQAAALAKPVVTFAQPPHYTAAFLENQKRLLGPSLHIAAADEGQLAAVLREWLDDPARAQLLGRQGRARIGAPGGSRAIAREIGEALSRRPAGARMVPKES